MKYLDQVKKNKWIVILIGMFAAWYSVFSVIKYYKFDTFIFDLGYYDQLLWLVSHGKQFYSSVIGAHPFNDHVSPSLFLLTPLYVLLPSPVWLLLVQAIFIPLGALPLYKMALAKTKSVFFALALSFSYLSFWGIMSAISFDFHMLTLGAPLLLYVLWFFETKRYTFFWVSIIIFAGLQENYLLFLSFLGVYLCAQYRDLTRGLLLAITSGVAFVIVLFLLIPWISGQPYAYLLHSNQNSLTALPSTLIHDEGKRLVILYSLGSFSFLPLLSPATWILLLEEFGGRFLGSSNPNWWSLGFHYNALLASIMAIGTLDVARRFREHTKLISFCLISTTLLSVCLVQPDTLQVFSPQFYDFTKRERYAEVVSVVPAGASIGVANDIGSHLMHRTEVQFLANCHENPATYGSDNRRCYRELPEYLLSDLSEDANWNAFYPDYDRESIVRYFDYLTNQKLYKRVYEKNNLVLLKKI